MVKSALAKNTIREIIHAPGRYLAMLGIILLGAGFFAGLRNTRDSIILTADSYYRETAFFDLQLVSGLGFEKDAPARLLAQTDGLSLEGAIQADALVILSGDDRVVRFHNLPGEINQVTLTEGRFPETVNEVLLDELLKPYFSLGEPLSLSSLNNSDTWDSFEADEFTVVGFCHSPLYINFERGSSAMGSGPVAGFAYLLEESFSADYYTSLYLSVPTPADAFLYSEAYGEMVKALEDYVKPLARNEADRRHGILLKAGEDALAEGEAEYAKGLEAYLAEKAKAESQLEEARQALLEGEEELTSGEKAYEEGLIQLETARAQAEEALKSGEEELEAALKRLSQGEQEYGEGLAQYQAGEAAYAAGLAQYEASASSYGNLAELYESTVSFRNTYDTLLQSIGELSAIYTDINLDPNLDLEARTKALEALWAARREKLQAEALSLAAAVQELADRLEREMGSSPALSEFKAMAENLRQTAESLSSSEMGEALTNLSRDSRNLLSGASALMKELSTQAESAGAQLEEARKSLNESRKQLNAARAKLAEAREELDEGWEAYFAGEESLRAAREESASELKKAEKELEEAAKKLEKGRKDVEEGRLALEEAESQAQEALEAARLELEAARKDLDKGHRDLNSLEIPALYLLGRNTNVGYVCLDNDAQIVSSVARVFPLFFFLIAALICTTTMARMVDEQRGQLGVLLALGYSRFRIMGKFLFYAGSAALLGCGIGIPLLSLFFPQILWQAYKIMYSFAPILEFSVDWRLFAIISGLYLFAMLFVTWLSLKGQFQDMPASILRPRAPRLGRRVALEHVSFIWKRLSFMNKVTLRNLFRYRARVLMMLLGVAGCTALMVTGYGIRDSVEDVVGDQYNHITLYEYDVSFKDTMTETEQQEFLEFARRYSGEGIFVMNQSVTTYNGKREKNAYMLSAAEDSDFSAFMRLRQGKKELSLPEPGQVLINTALARDLGLKNGDSIHFRLGETEYSLRVAGIFENYIYNFLILSDEGYRTLTGSEAPKKNAFVLKREGVSDATARLLGAENVVSVTAGSQMKDRIGSIMENMIYVVILTIVCSAALAFIVIFNLIHINITERMREIATVKVLGFFPGETAAYVLRENILLTALGSLLGIPLGLALNRYVMQAVQVDLVSFQARVKFPSLVFSVAFTILFSLAVYLIMMRKLSKIDMAQALKAAE